LSPFRVATARYKEICPERLNWPFILLATEARKLVYEKNVILEKFGFNEILLEIGLYFRVSTIVGCGAELKSYLFFQNSDTTFAFSMSKKAVLSYPIVCSSILISHQIDITSEA
jgi:hypothetical protein